MDTPAMSSPCDLTGKGALITGASRGIGKAVAELLARMGAKIAVHYGVDAQAADHVLKGLAGEGHLKLAADLGDPAEAARLAKADYRDRIARGIAGGLEAYLRPAATAVRPGR